MCRSTLPLPKSQSTDIGGGVEGKKMRSSSLSRKPKPAFDGAAFDKNGHCLKHGDVQLADPVVGRDGKLMWKEIKMNCPKCASDHHKSRRVTSLGGAGKVKRGRTVHGMSNPLRTPLQSGRHMDKEFSSPFDDKGRCHHHPNVQMAAKKFNGGWNILMEGCPKCIEAKYEEDVGSVGSGRSRGTSRSRSKGVIEDDGSVLSKSSKKSVQTRTQPIDKAGKFDKNGCCPSHPVVQVAKKKLLGGWKLFRECPKCKDPDYDDMADNRSVSSRKSTGSTRSKKSCSRSVVSNTSRKGGRKTDRFGALPFDGEGYCHAHPAVRLAKKKALGGWKVLHDICPDCAMDASSNHGGSVRSKSSKRSGGKKGTGRVFDDSGSETSGSRSSGKSSGSRKKKIRVKDMRYQDENSKVGRYSGDVNEDHQPHGQGKIKYKDGSSFDGVWVDGSAAHGKSSKGKSSKTPSSSSAAKAGSGDKSSDWARKDITKPSNTDTSVAGGVKTVRRMKWMDYYGDPGHFTGEVDSTNMPNGMGTMRYDHGLVQEGMWTRGQFVEGSDLNCVIEGASTVTEEVDNTVKRLEKKVVSSSRSKISGVERNGKKTSSSLVRGQDP